MKLIRCLARLLMVLIMITCIIVALTNFFSTPVQSASSSSATKGVWQDNGAGFDCIGVGTDCDLGDKM